MEIILTLVFLAIFYSVLLVVRSATSKNPGVEGKPIMGEAFPKIEVLEPGSVPPQRPLPTEKIHRRKSPEPHVKVEGERVSSYERQMPVHTPVIQEPEHTGRKWQLKGKSEVKRAFVLSEILNRKY